MGFEEINKGLDGLFTKTFRTLGLPTINSISLRKTLGFDNIQLPPVQLPYNNIDSKISCIDVKLPSKTNVTPVESFARLKFTTNKELTIAQLDDQIDDIVTQKKYIIF